MGQYLDKEGSEDMRKNKLLFISMVMVLVFAVITGCGGAKDEQAPAAAPDKNTVLIEDYKFQPAEITVQKGETITWVNQDSVKHTATGSSFDTGLLGKGESAKQTFNESGTFDYICTPHPYMKGKVIVK